MRRAARAALLGALLGAGAASPAAAQAAPPEPLWSWSVWGASSVMRSGEWPSWGETPDRRLVQAGVRARRVIARGPRLRLSYTFDAIPLSLLTQPVGGEWVRSSTGPDTLRIPDDAPKRWVYGAGVVPVGFDATLRPASQARPFLHLGGGTVWFSRAVPHRLAERVNFTFEAALGVEADLAMGSVSVGYRFHHLSNANIAPVNPGVDAHMLFLAWGPGRPHRRR